MRSITRARRKNRRSLIGLTPLIDVVFILLVFFMLASSFLDWRSIMLAGAGPLAPEAGPGGLAGAVLVDVAADGAVRLSGRWTDRTALIGDILALMERRPETGVVLRPAPGLALQDLVDLIDLMSAQGIAAITVQRGE